VWAVESGRALLSAAVVGIAGLGRETNLLVAAAQPVPRNARAIVRTIAAVALAVAPLLIWEDYLRSIYRSTIFAGADQLTMPGAALRIAWTRGLDALRGNASTPGDCLALTLLVSLVVQATYVLVRREYASAWWRVAVSYVALMLVLDRVLADPQTGAITRVLLPLTIGFNILLASESRPVRFWTWFVAGNLHLLSALTVMPLLP
jgi:hypothetical protein